jgi:hypothetical protein
LIWYIQWWIIIEWSINNSWVNNAKYWELVSTWDITFNWIATITSNSACPTIRFNWPLLYLISHTFFDVVQEIWVLFFTYLLCNA